MKRRTLLSIPFCIIYVVALLIGDCLGAGYPWTEGLGHALFFGTFGACVSLPLLLLLQAGLTRLVHKLRGTPAGPVRI